MNQAAIPDAPCTEAIDYLAEELCSSWHPEKPGGCRLALNPNYEHDKTPEHRGKHSGGVDALNIVSGATISEIEADARALAGRRETEREIG